MKLEEMPETVRLKLGGKSEKELWEEIEERGGIKQFSRAAGYSPSQLYNWRNKESFLPVKIVTELVEDPEVEALKGRSSSRPILAPKLPLEISDELGTRTEASVSVNREGTPVYITQEHSLVERFRELLENLGKVPTTIYSRDQYELRFPKYLHTIIEKSDTRTEFRALFDEKGSFEDGKMVVEGMERDPDSFDQILYSEQKKLELALKKGDGKVVRDILAEQASKIEKSELNREL